MRDYKHLARAWVTTLLRGRADVWLGAEVILYLGTVSLLCRRYILLYTPPALHIAPDIVMERDISNE